MGKFPSKEEARLKEIDKQLSEAHQRARELWPAVKAELAAGIPPENRSKQATIYLAARRHVLQLTDEAGALTERWCECHLCGLLLADFQPKFHAKTL